MKIKVFEAFSGVGAQRILFESEDGYRVRKLTPLECWRLMGFYDKDFECAKASGMSNTQLYKQAGNSIVVPVLEEIFSQLFKEFDKK